MRPLRMALLLSGMLTASAHAQEIDPHLTRTQDPGVYESNPAALSIAERLFLRAGQAELQQEGATRFEQVVYPFDAAHTTYTVTVTNIVASALPAYDALEIRIEKEDETFYLRDLGLDGHCDAGSLTSPNGSYRFVDERRRGRGVAGAEHEASFQQLYEQALLDTLRELE